MLDIVASYHCMEFHGKLTTQTQENGKKTNFGPDLDLLGPNSGRHFFFFFFFKNLDSSITRYQGQLSSYSVSGKTDHPVLRKLSGTRTDGHCPTNTERPKWERRESTQNWHQVSTLFKYTPLLLEPKLIVYFKEKCCP